MIKYNNVANGEIGVYLDNHRIGTIVFVSYGPTGDRIHKWRYVTKNGKGGELFDTIQDVKRSLEQE